MRFALILAGLILFENAELLAVAALPLFYRLSLCVAAKAFLRP